VIISDRPGNLARLTQCVAELGANILQIAQQRGFGQMAIGETEVDLVVETTGKDHIEQIRKELTGDGFHIKSA
jgi:threonine dehydratase